MANIHQIQLRYDAHEDRALLRLATTDRDEFRFWVTRRYARLLWAGLTDSAARSARALGQPEPAARDALVAFEHEAALERADFQTAFRDDAPMTRPLGDDPVLLAQVKCAQLDGGHTLLGMHPLQGQGVELRLDPTLLHSLLKLLARELTRAARATPLQDAGNAPTRPVNAGASRRRMQACERTRCSRPRAGRPRLRIELLAETVAFRRRDHAPVPAPQALAAVRLAAQAITHLRAVARGRAERGRDEVVLAVAVGVHVAGMLREVLPFRAAGKARHLVAEDTRNDVDELTAKQEQLRCARSVDAQRREQRGARAPALTGTP